jgi:hypothetical protein
MSRDLLLLLLHGEYAKLLDLLLQLQLQLYYYYQYYSPAAAADRELARAED